MVKRGLASAHSSAAPTASTRWSKPFVPERRAGLLSRHAGRPPTVLTPALEARILDWTVKRNPTDGSTHWSTRKLAAKLKVSHMMIARVWKKHGLSPHRIERYMSTDDPDFETKAADIICLYLHPPQHAAVFCVDQKTAIQALDRNDPVLPLSRGRAEKHGFEHFRHGTLPLYAAFNTKTGEVLGKTALRHTSAEFVEVRRRPQEEADALHPSVQQVAEDCQVEVLRPVPASCYRFSRYSPLVSPQH